VAAGAVYLVPIGGKRFELYTEPAEEPTADDPRQPAGFWHRTVHQLQERWRHAVHTAHEEKVGGSSGRIARARDWIIRGIDASIAEQRTLWSFRGMTSAAFVYPDDLTESSAAEARGRLLVHARRHHGWWLLVNLVAAVVTAVLILLPGPNVIGYYFLFRVVAHFLSWSGARHALVRTVWHGRPEPALSELAALAGAPIGEREPRLASIAGELHLPRLVEFFDRVAAPGR
jgi:hypothetical protein